MKGNFEDHDDMVYMCIYSIKQAYVLQVYVSRTYVSQIYILSLYIFKIN